MTYHRPNRTGLDGLAAVQEAANDSRKQDQLLRFVSAYRDQHDGRTPTIAVIANELNVLETVVNLMLMKLEDRGLLSIVGRNPLRIMFGKDKTPKPDPERYTRYLQADAQRHRLGRFIGETVRKTGKGPTLREAMAFMDIGDPAYVARMATILAEHNIIKKTGPGLITARLTPSGEALYKLRIVVEEDKMSDTEINPTMPPKAEEKPKVVVVNRGHGGPSKRRFDRVSDEARDERVAKALAEYLTKHDGLVPEYRDLIEMTNLGHGTIAKAVASLIARGILAPRFKAQKRSLKFTNYGNSIYRPNTMAFPPQPVAPERPPAEAETRVMPQTYGDIAPRLAAHVAAQALANKPQTLADFDTADLVLELIDRGYIVKRGS